SHRGYLVRKHGQSIDHGVNRVRKFGDFALGFEHQFSLQVAVRHGGYDFRDAAYLSCKVSGHQVYVVGQILPCTGDTAHIRLTAEFSVGTDFASHARHFARESIQLVHHDVNGVLQLQNLTAHVYRDLTAQIASRHRRRDFRDVSHLRRQVSGHRVHRLGEVL